jgi:hypothetical protein
LSDTGATSPTTAIRESAKRADFTHAVGGLNLG